MRIDCCILAINYTTRLLKSEVRLYLYLVFLFPEFSCPVYELVLMACVLEIEWVLVLHQ